MERREFLSWTGIGLLASTFPMAIAACSPESTTDSGETSNSTSEETTAARTDGFVAVGTVQQLQQDGSVADKKSKVIVVQDGVNPKALSLVCTHQQCNVEWRQSSNSLYCPCHGSEFDTAGKVLKGPATESLSSYEVKEEGDDVLVKVG